MADHEAHRMRALLDLNARVDDLVEDALQSRLSLGEAMITVLPALCEAVGARGAFLRSFSEDLALQSYVWPPDFVLPDGDEILARTGPERREEVVATIGGEIVVAQPLDVAGEWFGCAGVVLPAGAPNATDTKFVAEALNITCEELDNFLYSIRSAREKHRVMMELGNALRHRVLGEGLRQAVEVLSRAISLDRLLLVCVAQEGNSQNIHVQAFDQGLPVVDTMGANAPHPEEAAILEEARACLRSNDRALQLRLGLGNSREEVLINGVTQSAVVGKVLVTSRSGSFNTYDRELLAGFGGFIRQRIVDFNKEWRTMARSFRPDDVTRLLQEDNYIEHYLTPREAEVAMLYVDIAGFTRLSEQVLKTPNAVATLVEAWSREAVQIVWNHTGVFDKMVGDCVIALFGPPFYDTTPGQRLLSAIRCAIDIREMTRKLPERPEFAMLRESGLAVTTGANLAPLFVGQFGPNDNFTGFSSGMNNTARLQGCADRNEIVVMVDSIARLPEGHGLTFGEERSTKVKNVAEPIRFRPVG